MEVQRGIKTNIQELDVVRALHQTVVSLRSALEASRSELKDLRQKYESRVCAEGVDTNVDKICQVNKNSTAAEERINDDLIPDDKKEHSKKVKFNIGNKNDKVEELNESIVDIGAKEISENLCGADNLNNNNNIVNETNVNSEQYVDETFHETKIINGIFSPTISSPHVDGFVINKEETTIKEIHGEFETKVELESKFDVTIKVSALKAGDGFPIVVETSDSDTVNINFTENKSENNINNLETVTKRETYNIIHDETFVIEARIDSEMAGSKEGNSVNNNNEKLNVHVKITSEEDLLIDPFHTKDHNPDQLTAEPDDISVRSISEGDNSVFSENIQGDGGPSKADKTCDQENMSGNESEEVDDIELIFTTDDTKEFSGFQEDLVSIQDGDHWTSERSNVSTPVLLKFNVFDPDAQTAKHSVGILENRCQTSRKGILRKDIQSATNVDDIIDQQNSLDRKAVDKRPFLRSSSSKNYLETSDSKNLYRKSFESNESFSFDNQKSFSFDNTNTKSSSFERGSSIDVELRELSFDHRDESLDQFDTLKTTMKTQYTVCVETDISKCGIPDDDGFPDNHSARRNTCPNPFQYRPLSHREVFRGGARPLLAPPGQRAPRRSSAAQTHISALPTQWRSDTHLSKKTLPLALTTLPSKIRMEELTSGNAVPSNKSLRPSRKTEEARRVLLSDIGFTSMVPELSRSAEPIWAGLGPSGGPLCCAQHANCLASVPCSPTSPSKQECSHSRYWSKGSMQHSFSGKLGDSSMGPNKLGYLDQGMRWRGSLPELRPVAVRCGGIRSGSRAARLHDSEDSTDELLDEADRFLTSSIGCLSVTRTAPGEFCPSQYSRPYLPSGPRQLRLGHLVKVITPHGRIALGKVKYVGVAGGPCTGSNSAPTYVGLLVGKGVTLGASGGDGSFRGRRYFHCEPGRSLFVPFSKVVMAWADY